MGGDILAAEAEVEVVAVADEEAEAEAVIAAAAVAAQLVPIIRIINRHQLHPSPNRAASSADPTMASTNVPNVASPIVL